MPAHAGTRLQKRLADLGYGSRREIERWIVDGRIAVNGEPARLGQRIGPTDSVTLDGSSLAPTVAEAAAPARVLALNKAAGVVCSRRDPEGRTSVFDGLPRLRQGRWISVGRLDIPTTGLLLLTNDGALAHRMMHPATGLDREYAVRVDGLLSDESLAQARDGVRIDGAVHRFSDIRHYDGRGRNQWYHVVVMDGRNHTVRKLFDALGHPLSRLKRVRYGPVILPAGLRRGRYAALSPDDLERLYRLLKLPLVKAPDTRPGRVKPSLLTPYPELPDLTGAGA